MLLLLLIAAILNAFGVAIVAVVAVVAVGVVDAVAVVVVVVVVAVAVVTAVAVALHVAVAALVHKRSLHRYCAHPIRDAPSATTSVALCKVSQKQFTNTFDHGTRLCSLHSSNNSTHSSILSVYTFTYCTVQ